MLIFWIGAALLTAAAMGAMSLFAARTGREGGEDAAALEPYRRQLQETEALAARGLLDAGEAAAARAEAGRRLLRAAEQAEATPQRTGPRTRAAVLLGLAAAPVLALGLYAAVGSPEARDRPYAARLAAWRAADPATLPAPAMAAVMTAVARERPEDPRAWLFLGRTRLAAEDAIGAAEALRRAAALQPRSAEAWSLLGAALAVDDQQSGRPLGVGARTALDRALALDPQDGQARYLLARSAVAEGRREEGLTRLRALAESLTPTDPRRQALREEIAALEGRGAPGFDAEQRAAIDGMMSGLEARLKAAPEDADGWVRLVRAYAVLGRTADRDRALAAAKARFAARPEVLAALEAAARTPAGL